MGGKPYCSRQSLEKGDFLAPLPCSCSYTEPVQIPGWYLDVPRSMHSATASAVTTGIKKHPCECSKGVFSLPVMGKAPGGV